MGPHILRYNPSFPYEELSIGVSSDLWGVNNVLLNRNKLDIALRMGFIQFGTGFKLVQNNVVIDEIAPENNSYSYSIYNASIGLIVPLDFLQGISIGTGFYSQSGNLNSFELTDLYQTNQIVNYKHNFTDIVYSFTYDDVDYGRRLSINVSGLTTSFSGNQRVQDLMRYKQMDTDIYLRRKFVITYVKIYDSGMEGLIEGQFFERNSIPTYNFVTFIKANISSYFPWFLDEESLPGLEVSTGLIYENHNQRFDIPMGFIGNSLSIL